MGLRVCLPFVGDTVGGSHISALRLVRGLPKGFDPVIVLHQAGPLEEYLKHEGLAFERAPDVDLVTPGTTLAQQVVTMFAAAPRLATFLRARQIDIVHTNDGRMHMTWGLAAKLARAKFVWHQRSAESSRRLGLYSRLASSVLTVSNFCKSQLTPSMRRRATVVLNPFDPSPMDFDRSEIRSRILVEMGVTDEGTRIVAFVAHLTPRKRPLVFVEMAAQLMTSASQLVFPMFGDPREPLRREVEALIAARRLTGRCRLMGNRSPIEPWIAACDVVVAPAVAEPFGRAVVEPTLVGTPVVAADDGGNREIIAHNETGLLVLSDDPGAFAAAVGELLNRPAFARRIADAALNQARQRFSDQDHVRNIMRIYSDIARGSAAR